MSDKIFIDLIPPEFKPAMEAMLADEVVRQDRLKASFRQNEETAELVSDDVLFANYKLLQFFDTLALYFHLTHPSMRGESTFLNVPQAVGNDVEIKIRPLGEGRYHLSPYPFSEDEMTFSYQGRLISPQPEGSDLKQLMADSEVITETITVVAHVA